VLGDPVGLVDSEGLKSYQCTKPIGMFGGDGRRSGPDIWGNPFYHQYSCVLDSNGSICGGLDRTGNFLGAPGVPSNDNYKSELCDEIEDSTPCFEKCLKNNWKKSRPWYGFPFGTDCQEYDDDLHDKCRKICKM